MDRERGLAPASVLSEGISLFASPKQAKSRPLESSTYEIRFCKPFVLIFMQNDGGWGIPLLV
jgi:hypothetical protein